MGCCLTLMRAIGLSEQAEITEYTPISSYNEDSQATRMPVAAYRNYQAIIDDAQGKFISTSYRHRTGVPLAIADIHSRVAGVSLDVSLAESPSLSEQKSRDSLNRNIIVDVLSDPVVIPPQIEMITDEIAEIVTNHAFNVVRIDDSQSALASFQRVSGSTFNSSM